MIISRKQYNDLQKGIKDAKIQRVDTKAETRKHSAANYVYTAKVTLSTNTATGSTDTVWIYQAEILYTPFGKTDLDAWEITDTAKSGDTDLLLSKYDLAAHGTYVVYLPCVLRGIYFENLLSSAGTVTVDDISINYNTADELQIFGFETGLPVAEKSIAEILMGV